jgi:hypothetical protein
MPVSAAIADLPLRQAWARTDGAEVFKDRRRVYILNKPEQSRGLLSLYRIAGTQNRGAGLWSVAG